MASNPTKPSAQDAQKALIAHTNEMIKQKGTSGATFTTPSGIQGNPTPSTTSPITTTTVPKSTISAYGVGSTSGAMTGNTNTTGIPLVPMFENGQVVNRPVHDVIGEVASNPNTFKMVGDALRASGQVGLHTNDLKTIQTKWAYMVNQARRLNMNPFDYINSLGTAATTPSLTTTYVTDYSGSKGQSAFQSAFNNVFGRNPVAGDQLSPFKDSKGNPISWITALNNEAQKPGNSETVSRNKNGSMVITKGGFNAQAWLTGQLTEYYRKGIQTGTMTPENGIADKYASLANDYGVNVYDPTTKALNTNARLDLSALETKTKTLDQIKQGWANAAVAKYGNLTPQLVQAGLTLRQVADPALNSMSNILGIDKSSIALDDQLVQKYLAGDGKSVMPAYQYEQLLRQDPRWKTSKDAQDNLSNVALSMAKTFGVMG